MSTDNEGQGPEQNSGYGPAYPAPGYGADPGGEPTAQFDAFRARQADEREQQQQETQTAYTFPPEYAADPDAVFMPPFPPPPPAGDGSGDGDGARSRKMRSLLIFAGAVLVVCVMGLGAWLAFGSSGPSTNTASTGSPATAAAPPTGTAAGTAKRELTFRVIIASVGSDSFTGTVPANSDSVTVTITSKTHFGTKTHAFAQSDLTVGETVIVRGRRTGTGTITATEVAANVAKATSTATAAGAAA
jgi:hypothetical protein